MRHSTTLIQLVRQPEQAVALLDPERLRLVEALAELPDSASGLARRLGEKRQRLNYHLRTLQEAGLVEVVHEKTRGNSKERVLRPVARNFVLDPGAAGTLGECEPEEAGDRFSADYLVALASRAIRELSALLFRSRTSHTRLATASVNTTLKLGSPADFSAFAEDLAQAIAGVVARHHNEEASGGRWFRVVSGAYPGPKPQKHTNREKEQ